ncbi:MAG TPA: alkaline phosphatase family protein [Ktedonobacterales bacterium]|nr:alkaline phosphatase family protein [Ktedonobacterales bacterium]
MRSILFRIAAYVATLGLLAAGVAIAAQAKPAQAGAGGVPHYKHIFYIMMENHTYSQIIGNTAHAPHLNAMANTYGLATNFWAVTHPSTADYVASVAGDPFNAVSDASYQKQQVLHPSLFSQLEDAGLTWKTYQQSIPSPGFTGIVFPSSKIPLYAAKHNPVLNFLSNYGPAPGSPDFPNAAQQRELNNMVPDTQLATDLADRTVPTFSYIVPDQCHDMHGISDFVDNGIDCDSQRSLISAGDTYVNDTVQMIMGSKTWQEGNNAIVITWDENDFRTTEGPTNIASAGGHIPTIVIANHGPRGVEYDVAANHYSLLLTIEGAFGLGCLANSCPTDGGVQPMTPLFRR